MSHAERLGSRWIYEEGMTARARLYLSVSGSRNAILALACLLIGDQFKASSYALIMAVLPIWAWGVAFAIGAIVCFLAAWRRSLALAYMGLTGSAVTCAVWGTGFIVAWVNGTSSGPTGAIIWLAVALKDLIVCRQPMRSPFEPLMRMIAEEDRRR